MANPYLPPEIPPAAGLPEAPHPVTPVQRQQPGLVDPLRRAGYRGRTIIAIVASAMLLATAIYLYIRGDAWAPIVTSDVSTASDSD